MGNFCRKIYGGFNFFNPRNHRGFWRCHINAPGGFFAHLAVVDFFLINVFSRLLKPHLSMSTDDCAVDHGIQLNIRGSRFSKKF